MVLEVGGSRGGEGLGSLVVCTVFIALPGSDLPTWTCVSDITGVGPCWVMMQAGAYPEETSNLLNLHANCSVACAGTAAEGRGTKRGLGCPAAILGTLW